MNSLSVADIPIELILIANDWVVNLMIIATYVLLL